MAIPTAHTPSTLHLLLLDALIASLQLILLILAFGQPPSAAANSAAALGVAGAAANEELQHDYSALLGREWRDALEEEGESEEDEDGEGDGAPREGTRSRTLHSLLCCNS